MSENWNVRFFNTHVCIKYSSHVEISKHLHRIISKVGSIERSIDIFVPFWVFDITASIFTPLHTYIQYGFLEGWMYNTCIPLLLGYAVILWYKCTYFLLVEFFEGLALESKIDDDKPMIMKNSIHARKTLQRRAKTNKIKKARSNSKEYFWNLLQIFCFAFWLTIKLNMYMIQ